MACLSFYLPVPFSTLSDLREPFNLQKGWLLWAGIGLIGAIGAIALTGVAVSYFGEPAKREVTTVHHFLLYFVYLLCLHVILVFVGFS